jgi:hypothetical protein
MQVVLGDIDASLAAKGMAAMTPQERAVAVRKLICATGSRGMGFALAAAVEDVVRYRAAHRPR